jgi:hypothetical protein
VSAEPHTRWDGRRWVSADALWAWNGSRWVRFGSNLTAAKRVAIYGGIGLGLSLPIMFVLALFWGLQGPGWDYNPPDIAGSVVQVALTLGGALVTLVASWFLTRIDRRDWWLGAVVAWPWIVIGGILSYGCFLAVPLEVAPGCGCNPTLDGALVIGLPLLFVVLSLTGSIVGSWRLPSTRPDDPLILGYAAVSADPPQLSLPETTVEDATHAEATNTHQNGKSASWWRALAESIYLLNPNNNLVGCGSSLILILILSAILYWILG